MTYSRAILAEQATREPFWIAINERRRRERAKVGAIAFVEHFDRCPECMARQASEFAAASSTFDAARDRALVRRDVNEALEVMTLEALTRDEWAFVEGEG